MINLSAIRAAHEEQRASELLRRDQFIRKVEENPALRQAMQPEAQRKLEKQQDVAFEEMQGTELNRICSIGCVFQEWEAQKRFYAWRRQARLELQQLRETQRLSAEHLGRTTDNFISALEGVTWYPLDTGESHNTITLEYATNTVDLPITTPAAFALTYQSDSRPWFRSRNEETVSPLGRPPGRRFSLCEMPQIHCDPQHYRRLQESVEIRLVKGSSDADQTPRKGFGLWTQLARLMWKGEVATNDTVKDGDRLQLR